MCAWLCVSWHGRSLGGALARPVLGMVQHAGSGWFGVPRVAPHAPPEVQPRRRRKRPAEQGANSASPQGPGCQCSRQRGLQWRPRQGQQQSRSRLLRAQHVAATGSEPGMHSSDHQNA
jgi:hypothetical protein